MKHIHFLEHKRMDRTRKEGPCGICAIEKKPFAAVEIGCPNNALSGKTHRQLELFVAKSPQEGKSK